MFDFRVARQTFLRLLLAFASLVGAVQFVRWLLVPAIQFCCHPGEGATSAIRRASILVLALLAYWAYVRIVERRTVRELHPAPLGIVIGGISGALTILLVMGVLFASGVYVVTAYRGLQSGLWGIASLIIVAAMLEEIAYRAILFRILENARGTVVALWLQSLVFAIMHLANIDDRASTQELVITIVSGTLIGAFWTFVFVLSRNLWVVAANHAAWNFTIILAGLPLSGLEDWLAFAPLASAYHGPGWLTGGVFGPEDSVLTIAVVALSLLGMFRFATTRGRLVSAGSVAVDGNTARAEVGHA